MNSLKTLTMMVISINNLKNIIKENEANAPSEIIHIIRLRIVNNLNTHHHIRK